ncbi:hypothetical protein LSCM1_01815 [Leishmania martiniquensis]|uniref:Uncharacterized protein n=1 Tax=Leishmania martiniquensis TaxID=1580590 RepID=A0A836KE63_9TRYP|nr:hypothetical protein LSCM1_01815 [Leishmania martiniquensis]
MEAPAEVKQMQLEVAQVGVTTEVLTMPPEEFANLHLQPLQDDSWIRHAEIVHMDNFVDTEGGERVKQEILKEYTEVKERQGTHRSDPILEGMMYQEQFMEAYRKDAHNADADKAHSYRSKLLEEHRRARAIKDAEP